MKVTASHIVTAIGKLNKDNVYNYVYKGNKGLIKIESVEYPEGPILIRRYDPTKDKPLNEAKIESISTPMIWRIANAFSEEKPINFDRILGASYNTRSVLESLIAHTPEFYFCYPGRVQESGSTVKIEEGHKHLLWVPNNPHKLGELHEIETKLVVSEIPTMDAYYDSLVIPNDLLTGGLDIEAKRRHSQIQIALLLIGRQLGFRTHIAQNDKSIVYNNQKIGEMDGVTSLKTEKLISSFDGAVDAAKLIDCIWFKNGKLMPAVIEIEHSTGVTSGLTRMKGLQDLIPQYPTRFVVVAPAETRDKVIDESNRPQFRSLDVRFFPYSAVEELYTLCSRRKIRGVTEEFLDCYMEPTLSNETYISLPN